MPECVLRIALTWGRGRGRGGGRGKEGPRRPQPHGHNLTAKRVNSLIDKIEMLQPERNAYIQFGKVL